MSTTEYLADVIAAAATLQSLCSERDRYQMDEFTRNQLDGLGELAGDSVMYLAQERTRIVNARSNVVRMPRARK